MRRGYEKRGYIYVRVGGRRQVPEHRLVMEQVLGRALLPSEHVHHINGVTTDNRPDNLRVLSADEHMQLTADERKARGEKWGFLPGEANPKWKDGRRSGGRR